MIKKRFRLTAIFLTAALVLSGCRTTISKDNNSDYSYEITIDVYDTLANFQGIQSGWFGKVVQDKFNMRLNIIAPNVSGSSDTLYETRFTTGNIGDLIICSATNGKLQSMVDAGLVLDMSSYLKDKAVYQNYDNAIDALNKLVVQDGIYAIPSEISKKASDYSSEGNTPTYGAYLRWDLYADLGYPKVTTLEDLLPILKKMQDATPYSVSGEPTYAFSLFSDWDGNLMNAIKQPCCFYGYDESGFVLASADGTDFQSVLDEDSLYMRSLEFYYEANQLGLVDPDSTTQTYNDVFEKYTDGQILFSPWPWLGQTAYNTAENMAQGKGYMFVPISDESIYSNGCKTYGNYNTVIAVGSQAEDPSRLVDFIDWLYSDDGIRIGCAQNSLGTAGIEGLTWTMEDSGPVLTQFGISAFIKGDATVPEKYGGGSWDNGVSQLNFRPVSNVETDSDGYAYNYSLWDSVKELNDTPLQASWQKYSGYSTVMDFLNAHDQITVSPGSNYTASDESTEISTIRTQCARLVVEYSWKMVFAANMDEYKQLKSELISRANALGYDTVYAFDLENAKADAASKQEVLSND